MKINKENSDDLGFVLASLACQAITLDEFKEWVGFAIGNLECPEELIDLMNVKYVVDAYKILSFTPVLADHEAIEKALYGVAYSRFSDIFDARVPKLVAEKALLRRDDVFDRFRDTFPFVKLVRK